MASSEALYLNPLRCYYTSQALGLIWSKGLAY